jgi:anthranilate phosphoribosyltransferase
MSSEAIRFATVFQDVTSAAGPSADTVRAAFDAILSGAWTPVQVAGFVVALRVRGESADVVAAAVSAMRSAMVAVDHGLEGTLDTCGTGGDGMDTLNVSTAAAIIARGAGATVAKHGNRAASSRVGSAEVLEALGIPLDVPADRQKLVLREAGIAFLFAPAHHPAMRHAGAARKELGIRTIFNVLGPLANPARVTHQLVGTSDERLRPIMAETLRVLGTRRAWVVRGEEGIDEVSPSGPTRVAVVDEGRVAELVITPQDFGFAPVDRSALAGGDATTNAGIILQILRGEPHPARGPVLLNAAAALVVARGQAYRDAAAEAERSVASGAALAALERWKDVATRLRNE